MSANQQVLSGLGGGVPVGQYLFTAALDNNAWVVPANVTSIGVVCVGPAAHTYVSGYGGCLRFVNNIAVTPGETLHIDNRDNGGRLRRGATVLCYGPAWYNRVSAVGTGGDGGDAGAPGQISGGGGAGGYSGNGGRGGVVKVLRGRTVAAAVFTTEQSESSGPETCANSLQPAQQMNKESNNGIRTT